MPTPRPSVLYLWDTNGTHIVAPTSGHMSDGFVNDEVVGSGETNGAWQNWTAWLAFLGGGHVWLARHVFFASGTFTPNAGNGLVTAIIVGDGGGGGGAGLLAVTNGSAAVGGGGSSGETLFIETFGSAITGGAVTVGPGGAGGSGLATGTSGSGCSAIIGGTTYTAAGGAGGTAQSAPLAHLLAAAQGGGITMNALSGNGVWHKQDPGQTGIALSDASLNANGVGGAGGSGLYGAGGMGGVMTSGSSANGSNAQGCGAGGGGAICMYAGSTISKTGGSGGAGFVIIDEYS